MRHVDIRIVYNFITCSNLWCTQHYELWIAFPVQNGEKKTSVNDIYVHDKTKFMAYSLIINMSMFNSYFVRKIIILYAIAYYRNVYIWMCKKAITLNWTPTTASRALHTMIAFSVLWLSDERIHVCLCMYVELPFAKIPFNNNLHLIMSTAVKRWK